jgi:hypothetical protein
MLVYFSHVKHVLFYIGVPLDVRFKKNLKAVVVIWRNDSDSI